MSRPGFQPPRSTAAPALQPVMRTLSSLSRRAKEHHLQIGRANLEFAYKRLPAHGRTARCVLDSVAILLGFALSCFILLASVYCCRAAYVVAYRTMEDALGYYEVEVTGVQASADFLSPREATTTVPRFNLTARVTNRYRDTKICLRGWQADLWYAGTPLGKAYFPDTCLAKMADTSVKASTSRVEMTGLLPVEIPHGGGPNLKIEMTLNYMEYKGRYNKSYRSPALHWLWCNAAVDMRSPPSSCGIRRLLMKT